MEAVSATTLRIIILVIGVLVLAGIYFFARPRGPAHGRRLPFKRRGDARIEPVLGSAVDDADLGDAEHEPRQGELDVVATARGPAGGAASDDRHGAMGGRRAPEVPVDKIVTLYVAAHDGESFHGSDIVVAAEKAGLQFGAMRIYHRLVDATPGAQPVFSMANMVKPGYFDMARIAELETPGLSFFATLPGPLPALDAWDAMLPTAQRMAELLDGQVLDEDRNALGRQRIAGFREELRDWDRHHEGPLIGAPRRR